MKGKKILLMLTLAIILGIVSGTYAYFTSTTTLNNEFKTGTYATSVTEEFVSPDNWTPGTTMPKTVSITNKGTVDVATRAKYTEEWTAADGTILSGIRDGEKVAQFTVGSNWIKATDGYYYYNDILTNGETSDEFISSVTFNPNFELEEGIDIECTNTNNNGESVTKCESLNTGYAGATYKLDITIETIQADQKWNYIEAYEIGQKITIAGENFNVVRDNGDTLTLLAQYNLGTNYRQNNINNYIKLTDSNGWEYSPGPKEINIQSYPGPAQTYVNNYVSYLKEKTGDTELSGTLITLTELGNLGCIIGEDYSPNGGNTCVASENASWLINGQYWWTRSAYSNADYGVWGVNDLGRVGSVAYFSSTCGIRPLITISKEVL